MVLKDKKYILLFLSPAIILVIIFLCYPLVQTVQYSFTDWRSISLTKMNFIGLQNYIDMAKDPIIHISLRNTLLLMLGSVIFQVGLALVLALMADSIKLGFRFFRTVFFFPIVISATAIGLMFSLIYGYEYGLLNYFLTVLGKEKQVWLTEGRAIYLVLIPVLWQYVGFYFVIFLTGISKIPGDIYESAALDGITGVKKAFYITIPLMWEVIATTLSLVIAGTLKVFDTIYVMTNGGPMNSTELLSTYMYNKAFSHQNGGYASAIAVALILLGVLVTGLLNRLTSRETVTM